MATVSSKQDTDRETAFQAAVDNNFFNQIWAADKIKSGWYLNPNAALAERWDYVANLNNEIEKIVRPNRRR